MARTRKSAEERQAEIIRTAVELIGEGGMKDVTAQAIADRVGIAQPTVFRHFPTRDAIFLGALKFVSGQIFRVLGATASRGVRADDRLRILLERQLAVVSRNRGLPRLLFSDRLHLEDPKLKQAVRGIMERYVSHVEEIVRDGQIDGSFREDLDPAASARLVAATVQGLLMRWSVYDFDFDLNERSRELWEYIHAALTDRTAAHEPDA